MHPVIEPLAFLIGSWRSTRAEGVFPGIKDFSYNESITFEEIGQPLLNFKSVSKIGDRPMHLESGNVKVLFICSRFLKLPSSGFLRINPNTQHLSFLVSHNFGICTIEEGQLEGTSFTLEAKEISRTTTAKEPNVTQLRRSFKLLSDGQLEIKTDMATTRVPELTNHLSVIYCRL